MMSSVNQLTTTQFNLCGRPLLSTLLNKSLLIKLSDGRSIVGTFLCVDREVNIILGSSAEFPPGEQPDLASSEGRVLGLAMVPGRHVVSITTSAENLEISP